MLSVSIRTPARDALIDISDQVQRAIAESGVRQGTCLVYCPHTTAGITINENADPAVVRDLLTILDRMVPWAAGYRHAEGNSAAHAKSSLFGCSASLIVEDGRALLGTWQSVFFCEFDGPRQRTFHVQITAA
jgi:secondary thiamine-phosphate synthase enzyme